MLLATAGYLTQQIAHSAGIWQWSLLIVCVGLAALLAVAPYWLEYRTLTKISEANTLTTVVAQLKNLESIAGQIGHATGQWQTVQEHADKTAGTAKEIAERMSAEIKGFSQFMEQVNDREKATLRLEVEKLRRAEADWLQVLVRMLDHVYALHAAAMRSSQPTVIEQVGNLQNACRDLARRVGLAAFTPAQAEPFDGQRHQLFENDSAPPAGAAIAETVAAGYTFQGRLLRPALVRIQNGNGG